VTEPGYRLGRTERRGAVLGWRPGQALAVSSGLCAFVLGLGAGPAGVVLGVAALLAGVVVAAVPVRGRGLDEWVPVAAGFVCRPRRGALCAGAVTVPASDDGPAHLRWPDGTATTFARLEARGLRALEDDPRATGESLATWLRGLGHADAPARVVTLLTSCGPGHPPGRDAPWADPGRRCVADVAVTAPEPVDVAAELAAAGVTDAVSLEVGDLDALLADRGAPGTGSLLGCDVVARWVRLDGPASVHAAFVVDEWPSGEVDEQALAPLCTSRDRRTVALSLHVEEPSRAKAKTARARTAAAADEAVTAAGGFLGRPEASRDEARDAERAVELVAGHAALRVVGVVGLDASDALELAAATARLLVDATACGLRLRRCDGDHRRGVLASLAGWCVP
jgi:hypothetical protein